MANKCENCGQSVMVTDSQCWHCGRVLNPDSELAAPQQEAASLPDVNAVVRFAGLTALSLLLLIFATRAIGQAPLLRVSGSSTPPIGWQPVTDSQLQFTLNLPATWQAIELTTAPNATILTNTPPVPVLVDNFAALVADSELLFLGIEGDTAVFQTDPIFVLVAKSNRLTRLSAEQLVVYAQQTLPATVQLIDADTAKRQLRFDLRYANVDWRCKEQFIPAKSTIYLVTTCASAARFSGYAADFETILRSFQLLDS
jgi:hypothetical protein